MVLPRAVRPAALLAATLTSGCWCYEWPVLDPDCGYRLLASSPRPLELPEGAGAPTLEIVAVRDGDDEPWASLVTVLTPDEALAELPLTEVGSFTHEDPEACGFDTTVSATLSFEGDDTPYGADERLVTTGGCGEFLLVLGDWPVEIGPRCMSYSCE